MRTGSDEPDWQWLGTVAERLGLDWARTLRDALASGTLIDLGECEQPSGGAGDSPQTVPDARDIAGPKDRQMRLV